MPCMTEICFKLVSSIHIEIMQMLYMLNISKYALNRMEMGFFCYGATYFSFSLPKVVDSAPNQTHNGKRSLDSMVGWVLSVGCSKRRNTKNSLTCCIMYVINC